MFDLLSWNDFVERISLLEHNPKGMVHERFTAVQAHRVFFFLSITTNKEKWWRRFEMNS